MCQTVIDAWISRPLAFEHAQDFAFFFLHSEQEPTLRNTTPRSNCFGKAIIKRRSLFHPTGALGFHRSHGVCT